MTNWALDQAAFMRAGDQTVGIFNEEQAWRYVEHMEEECQETAEAMTSRDYVAAIDGAVDTIVVAIGFLHSIGVDPDKAWQLVHQANMSKVIDGKVYRREDGQIGKPKNFVGPEAALADLFRQATL